MLLMCLSILACWAALKAWEVYMVSVKPKEWLEFTEAKHRRRLEWAELIGGRGKRIVDRIVEWFAK